MAEFIYTMKNVRKAHGDKVILDNVTMSFYPGAKIGVVGPNGAGKSSILKIMAGLEQQIQLRAQCDGRLLQVVVQVLSEGRLIAFPQRGQQCPRHLRCRYRTPCVHPVERRVDLRGGQRRERGRHDPSERAGCQDRCQHLTS